MVVGDALFESDGKSVYVTLEETVPGGRAALADGWLGVSAGSGDSGDVIALSIDRREYQFTVPTALAVDKGDTVYVTLASVTNNLIPDAAYSKTSGAGKVALFKATADQDANDVVTGILLPVGS